MIILYFDDEQLQKQIDKQGNVILNKKQIRTANKVIKILDKAKLKGIIFGDLLIQEDDEEIAYA